MFGNLATGHFSGKFIPNILFSRHAGPNDNSLKSVSCSGTEFIGDHTGRRNAAVGNWRPDQRFFLARKHFERINLKVFFLLNRVKFQFSSDILGENMKSESFL